VTKNFNQSINFVFSPGDGAGVGKGRQIAGIIMDMYLRGERKFVWVSVSADLRHDAERDLRDIGCNLPVQLLTKVPYPLLLDFPSTLLE
jgi:hypothetical protein